MTVGQAVFFACCTFWLGLNSGLFFSEKRPDSFLLEILACISFVAAVAFSCFVFLNVLFLGLLNFK